MALLLTKPELQGPRAAGLHGEAADGHEGRRCRTHLAHKDIPGHTQGLGGGGAHGDLHQPGNLGASRVASASPRGRESQELP